MQKRSNLTLEFFQVPKYADALTAVAAERGIETSFNENLVKVDATRKIAKFQAVDENKKPIDGRFEEIQVRKRAR